MPGRINDEAAMNKWAFRPGRRTLLAVLVFALLLGVGIAGRLLPHPPNFTPVAAAALFAGFFFTRRAVAVFVPVAILAFSDLRLGTYHLGIMLIVYGAFLFPVALRPLLRPRVTALRVGACAASGSVFFFLSTNFAVWLFAPLYAHSPAGLWQCYVAAVPFFKFTVLGDLLWSGVFFGTYAVVTQALTGGATGRKRLLGIRFELVEPGQPKPNLVART